MKATILLMASVLVAMIAAPLFSQDEAASDNNLKFMHFLVGDWKADDGKTSTWMWTLNGHFLAYESRNADGNTELKGFAGWNGKEAYVENHFFTSSGNVYRQTWSRKGDAVVVCLANGKYLFEMRPIDDNSWVTEWANGKTVTWTRK